MVDFYIVKVILQKESYMPVAVQIGEAQMTEAEWPIQTNCILCVLP